MRHSRRRRWLVALVAAWSLIGPTQRADAAEEAARFLEAIRNPQGRFGYFDTALDFLEMAKNDPAVDQEFKDAVDFEAGVTWIMAAGATGDMTLRRSHLEQAETRLKRFLADHSEHAKVPEANSQLASVLLNLGQLDLDAAARTTATPDERAERTVAARVRFEQSQTILAASEAQLAEENRGFPAVIDPRDTDMLRRREQVAGRLAAVRLAVAQMTYRISETHEPGSPESKRLLVEAAETYNEIYTKYYVEFNWLAGLEARMWEGRCYRDLGETAKAFDIFTTLLTKPDEPPAFRQLKTQALVLLLETALRPDGGQFEKALEEAALWESTSRGNEGTTPNGLAIKYLTAQVTLAHLAKQGDDADPAARKELLTAARKQFELVAKTAGKYQKDAREALRRPELMGEYANSGPEPTNFIDARDRARSDLERAEDKKLDDDDRAAARAQAIRSCREAMKLWTPDAGIDDLNLVRYYLAYLYLVSGDLHEAAVVGDVLARRFPETAAGREGARFALAACVRLYNEAPKGDRRFEAEQMNALAAHIAEQWQGTTLATEAWMTLIQASLKQGDVAAARQQVEKIPVDSPQRAEIELLAGQALWKTYTGNLLLPEEERPAQAAMDQMVAEAKTMLETGIGRMRTKVDAGAKITPSLATGVLSLVQICIGSSEPDKAVRWLEDPKVGPLTLVAEKHPVASEGNFAEVTHKAALHAYVSTQAVDKAQEAMKRLEALSKDAGDAGAGKRLTGIYLSLGRELQQQIERLRQQDKTDQLEKVSEAFQIFLDRIREGEGNTFGSLSWVAETYYSLGAGFDLGGGEPDDKAVAYYEKAADTYRRILKQCGDSDFGAPDGVETSLKIRLARCLGRLGPADSANFDEALTLLVEILDERNTMIDAQIEAAYVYQSRGEQDRRYYPLAIGGGKRVRRADGTEFARVWGWAKIAAVVAGRPEYESIFHQARYNMALCRFKEATGLRDAERTKQLRQAQTDIRAVYRLYPDMGKGLMLEPNDKDWREKYNSLLKTIQKLLGEPADGLEGLRNR